MSLQNPLGRALGHGSARAGVSHWWWQRVTAVALAPFDTEEAEDALRVLLADRDWQTRQIAEDLLDARPT